MPSEDDSSLAQTKEPEVSRKDIEEAKRKIEIEAIRRRGKITAWNDYIEFVTAKLVGIGALLFGTVESIYPNALSIDMKKPEVVAGIGLALLAGKGILSLIAKINKVSGEKS